MVRYLPLAALLLVVPAAAQDELPDAPSALAPAQLRRLRAVRRSSRAKRVPTVRIETADGTSWVVDDGFPALRDDGRVLAYVDREHEVCGQGAVVFLNVRSGEVVRSIPLPIDEVDYEVCVPRPAAVPPITRALRRFHTLRSMASLDPGEDRDPAWWVGRGVAIHGPTGTVYGLASGRRLGRAAAPDLPLREEGEQVLSVSRVEAGRYAVVVAYCACRCGVSTALRRAAP